MVSKKFQYPEGFNGTIELSLDVPTFADVDKEYQNAFNHCAKSVLPPTTEPWGQRTCYVADPDGNLIEIGSLTVITTFSTDFYGFREDYKPEGFKNQ